MANTASVKIYHGYGHSHNLVLYGHVFKYKAKTKQEFSDSLWVNLVHLLKLFVVKPFPFARVRLNFYDQIILQTSEYDGFFKFEWQATTHVEAGWHEVMVEVLDEQGLIIAADKGYVYVPHLTQYAFISDIDDTVMVSHSATIGKRLRELFVKNPRTRKTFPLISEHFQRLAHAHTVPQQPNPFFYVSSSEWNLYDYLVEMFRFNDLPNGVFLLNQLKRWDNLLRTGKTGHEGKLLRVMRIIDAFPNQIFVFFGDNSQQDPEIYHAIGMKYSRQVKAVYIRNVRSRRAYQTRKLLADLSEKGIETCLFVNGDEAIAHSIKIGLVVV